MNTAELTDSGRELLARVLPFYRGLAIAKTILRATPLDNPDYPFALGDVKTREVLVQQAWELALEKTAVDVLQAVLPKVLVALASLL